MARKSPRKKPRYLQEWEIEALSQAYLDGEKLEALAAEFNTLPTTISKLAQRLRYPRRKGFWSFRKGKQTEVRVS